MKNGRFPFIFKYLLIFGLFFFLGGSILCPFSGGISNFALAGEPPAPAKITLLHLNDYHGHWEPFAPRAQHQLRGGMARIAGKIENIRARNSSPSIPTLILEAGDILQGTVQSSVFKGEADITLRNQIGWTASAVGNHEFDYGQENLQRLVGAARFPFLSANIVGPPAPPWKPYIIVEAGALKVAVFGLTTADTPFTTHPKNVEGLKFLDPVPRARELVQELKPQADLIVALTHIGYDLDKRLAQEVPQIDVIIGGHSHTRLTAPTLIGSTIIVTAFEYGEFLGRLDLVLKNKKIIDYSWELIPLTPDIPEDPQVSALLARYRTQLDKSLTTVIGRARVDLIGTRETVRQKETNLGDLVVDALRESTGADIALVNGGNIRQSILAGPITMMDIMAALPFDNTIVVMKLSGRQIEEALRRSIRLPPGDGGFLQVSGLSFKVSRGQTEDIMVHGKPLDSRQYYKVAMSDFLAAGGDGYTIFLEGKDYYNTGLLQREAFVAYLQQKGTLEGNPDSRIIFGDEKR